MRYHFTQQDFSFASQHFGYLLVHRQHKVWNQSFILSHGFMYWPDLDKQVHGFAWDLLHGCNEVASGGGQSHVQAGVGCSSACASRSPLLSRSPRASLTPCDLHALSLSTVPPGGQPDFLYGPSGQCEQKLTTLVKACLKWNCHPFWHIPRLQDQPRVSMGGTSQRHE